MLLPPIGAAALNQQQPKWGARVLGRGQLWGGSLELNL